MSDIYSALNSPLTEVEIAHITYFSLLGLEYLHKSHMVHRDIKVRAQEKAAGAPDTLHGRGTAAQKPLSRSRNASPHPCRLSFLSLAGRQHSPDTKWQRQAGRPRRLGAADLDAGQAQVLYWHALLDCARDYCRRDEGGRFFFFFFLARCHARARATLATVMDLFVPETSTGRPLTTG